MKTLLFAALLLAGFTAPAWCGSYDDLNAGIAEHNRQEWDSAIAYLNKALAANDLTPDLQYVAHLDRGEAYFQKGQSDAAAADLTICVGQRPDDATPLFLRGQMDLASGKPDAARQDADAAMAADPDRIDEAYTLRAKAYEIEGDTKDQLKTLQIILAADPENMSANFDSGIAELLSGQADVAATAFAKLQQDVKGNPYYWLWLAMANLKQSKNVSGDVPYSVDLKNWPGQLIDFFRGRITQDAIYAAAGQGDERTVAGQICEANFYLGEWHLLHGDGAGAKTLLNKSAQDCPKNFIEWSAAKAELKNAS